MVRRRIQGMVTAGNRFTDPGNRRSVGFRENVSETLGFPLTSVVVTGQNAVGLLYYRNYRVV